MSLGATGTQRRLIGAAEWAPSVMTAVEGTAVFSGPLSRVQFTLERYALDINDWRRCSPVRGASLFGFERSSICLVSSAGRPLVFAVSLL